MITVSKEDYLKAILEAESEGDFLVGLGIPVPGRERPNVFFLYVAAVLSAEQVLKQDAQGEREMFRGNALLAVSYTHLAHARYHKSHQRSEWGLFGRDNSSAGASRSRTTTQASESTDAPRARFTTQPGAAGSKPTPRPRRHRGDPTKRADRDRCCR